MAKHHELEVLRQAVLQAGQQALKLAAEGFEIGFIATLALYARATLGSARGRGRGRGRALA